MEMPPLSSTLTAEAPRITSSTEPVTAAALEAVLMRVFSTLTLFGLSPATTTDPVNTVGSEVRMISPRSVMPLPGHSNSRFKSL